MMKKVISILLALTMLPMLVLPVAADTAVFDEEIQHSITNEEATGRGLAFRFAVNAQGAQVDAQHQYVNGSATIQQEGQTVQLVRMGAVVSNNPVVGQDASKMVLENTAANSRIVNVEGKYLSLVEENACAFTVRVIKIPDTASKKDIYVRPYYVFAVDGVEQPAVYGATNEYNHDQYYVDTTVLPAIGSDIDVEKQKDRIRVAAASREGDTVSLTFRNYTNNWITEETNYVKYTCYDAEGNALKNDTIYIGCIDTKKNKVKTFTFEVPTETVLVQITSSKIVYWTEWS